MNVDNSPEKLQFPRLLRFQLGITQLAKLCNFLICIGNCETFAQRVQGELE